MAAYAGLVSTMNTMDQIMNHPRLSSSFDKTQIQSLREILDFLLDFIESYTSHGGHKELQDLEGQIASAARVAEDVLESHVVNEIRSSSTSLLNLQKVIEEMDSVKEKVRLAKEEMRSNDISASSSTPSKPLTTGKKTTTMVGFDDELIQLMDVLTGQESSRMVISIVGMGGIGKTTLTKNTYENPLIVHHFDIRGWVTISQNFNVRQVLLDLLSCQEIYKAQEGSGREADKKSEDELGLELHKILWGRRYLVVLDDTWSVECWDKMRFFFPDCDNGSRVVVTTRLSNVATQFCSLSFKINFLDEHKSWDLFCRTLFLEEDCPLELEEIGKVIVEKCKGLPLSIAVIGAFLEKSNRRKEYWETVVRDINSILKSDEDEHCLNLLSLSYSHLPPHLKPCFLYMGILHEDEEIRVSRLIKLFVAEGFLKPNRTQTFEETAHDYLKDLIDRNLILVSKKKRWDGTAKYCYIHDLIREVCLREAEKEKFLHVMRSMLDDVSCDSRRIVFHGNTREDPRVLDALPPSAALVRTLFQNGECRASFISIPTLEFADINHHRHSPSNGTSEIWYMGQLRHLDLNEVRLPDPPSDEEEECVLKNLQTLRDVVNFDFSRDVCRRIPNVVTLQISYDELSGNNLNMDLDSLQKLQSLKCCLYEETKRGNFVTEYIFPSSIKKLSLLGWCFRWEHMTRLGMSLPRLEVLELRWVTGSEWNVEEGAFPRLKSLSICDSDLMYWNADSSHFPVLEKLQLHNLLKLDEIPLDFGDISTLGYLNLLKCSDSAAISSTKILKEQLGLGNEDIEVQVGVSSGKGLMSLKEIAELENFPKKNFRCTSLYGYELMLRNFNSI